MSNGQIATTMSYSISRLKKYIQCPYSWYKVYIEGRREDNEALSFGKAMHKIVENIGKECFKLTWVNKYMAAYLNVSFEDALYVYYKAVNNELEKSFSDISREIEGKVEEGNYTKVEMVDYDQLLNIKSNVIIDLNISNSSVLSELDMKNIFKEKIDKDLKKYTILGACNPKFAYKGIEMEKELGLLLPCNVIVYVDENDNTIVAAVDPVKSLGLSNNDDIDKVGEEIFNRLTNVIENM